MRRDSGGFLRPGLIVGRCGPRVRLHGLDPVQRRGPIQQPVGVTCELDGWGGASAKRSRPALALWSGEVPGC